MLTSSRDTSANDDAPPRENPARPTEQAVSFDDVYSLRELPRGRLGQGDAIIGVSGSWHDAAATLLQSDHVLGALEEERLTRCKHESAQFPVHAINALLSAAHLHWDQVRYLAIGWNYYIFDKGNESSSTARRLFDQIDLNYANARGLSICDVRRRNVLERNEDRFQIAAVHQFLDRMSQIHSSKHLPHVVFVPHHLAHAASAYYPSGLPEPLLVCVLDGYGEVTTTSVWLGCHGSLKHVASVLLPHSLGWIYSAVTEYLGFEPTLAEGEVMGLASYGAPRTEKERLRVARLREQFSDLLRIDRTTGLFDTNPDWFYFGSFSTGRLRVSDEMVRRLGSIVAPVQKPSSDIDPESPDDRPAVNLAYVLQESIEHAVVNLVRHFLKVDPRTRGARCLALAGGVAHNINANGRIIAEGLITADRLFVQPASGDAGTALGAAQVVSATHGNRDPHFSMHHAHYGLQYTDTDTTIALEQAQLIQGDDYETFADEGDLAREIAQRLARGHVIGIHRGRSEFGPRALGNRSILLNAIDPHSNEVANQVKLRQPWRPSAITITQQAAPTIINGLANASAPFMNIAYSTEPGATRIASGIHKADATTRPQTVTHETAPFLWNVLNHLGHITGVPCAVNTSFNRREPLVETPEEAINTFYYMKGMDDLCIGNHLVTRRLNLVPSIRAFLDEPLTRSSFAVATDTGKMRDYDLVFAKSRAWSTHSATLQVIVRNRSGDETTFSLPIAKEMLDDRTSRRLQLILASRIYNLAIVHGACEIFIGSRHRYGQVLFDKLVPLLRSVSPHLPNFVNFGETVRFLPLAEHTLHPPLPRPLVWFQPPALDLQSALGLDVGCTDTKVLLLHDGKPVWRARKPTPTRSPEDLCTHLERLIDSALRWKAKHRRNPHQVGAIGIALPGVVSASNPMIAKLRCLVDLEGAWHTGSDAIPADAYTKISDWLEDFRSRHELPTLLLNDANAFGVCELVSRQCHDIRSMVLAIGTGVGDVLLERGRIDFALPHQAAQSIIAVEKGLLSHSVDVPVSLADCLRRSTWERMTREYHLDDVERALASNRGLTATRAIEIIQRQASRIVDWLCHISRLCPLDELILTGGAISHLRGQALIDITNQLLKHLPHNDPARCVRVTRGAFDNRFAGAMGSACYALSAMQAFGTSCTHTR